MRDILVTAIVLIGLVLAFKRPHFGIYLWSWLSYMNPHKQTWGFAYSMPFALITAVVTILAYLFSREPKRMIWSPEIGLLLVFMVWMFISTIFALYPELAWAQWDKVWKIQMMTIMTLLLLTSRDRLHVFVWVTTLSIGYYGVKGGMFTLATGGGYRVWGPEGTFIGGNNEIALALVMIIPLFRYLQLQETRVWVRRGLALAMLLCAVAAIGSQSRGALLAIVAMGTFLWIKSRQKLATGLYTLVAVLLILLTMPAEWHERIGTIQNYQQDGSAMGRINAWHVAVGLAKTRITGGGFEAFQAPSFLAYAPDPLNVHDVHSIYFEVMGEHGIIGLLLWLSLGLVAWFRASKVIRACRLDPGRKWAADLAGMTQVSMIGYALGGAFLGLAYFDLYYHLIVLIVLTHHLAVKHAGDEGKSGRKLPYFARS